MPNVLNEYPSDGVSISFEVAMLDGYLNRDYVKFYIRNEDALADWVPYTNPVTWVGPYTFTIPEPVPAGMVLVCMRETSANPIVDFENTSRITERNLNTAFKQSLHRTVELEDWVNRSTLAQGNAAVLAQEAAQEAAASADVAEQAALGAVVLIEQAQEAAQEAAGYAQESAESAATAVTVSNEALELIEQAIKGNVDSFNGRDGDVVPQTGDYTPDMVGFNAGGELVAVPTWGGVPAWDNPALNAQATALTNRTSFLKQLADDQSESLEQQALLIASQGEAIVNHGEAIVIHGEELGNQAAVIEDHTQKLEALHGGVSLVEIVSAASRSIAPADSGKYLRFDADGRKTAEIAESSNFVGGEEVEIANRANNGLLLLNGNGVQINPVRGGTLRLGPGDTVKLKAVTAAVFDILYGTTSSDNLPLPTIADNNATFNDEGESTTGWTPTGATLSASNSYVRFTKTGNEGAACNIAKPWTFTPENRDFILYGKVRASAISQFDATVISIYNSGATKELALWLGYTESGTSDGYVVGAASIAGYSGATRKRAVVAASGLAYNTTDIEFALQYDTKFGQLNCWFREADGRWKLKARVKCDFASHTSVLIAKHSSAPTGAWCEFDYLTLCQPNIIAIGDSHCAGSTLFNADSDLGLNNDESSWMRHSNPYPSLRNNLIVNKGVGGQTSGQILARVTEVTRENPRVVFLHASSNDHGQGVSLATRTANIQNTVNAMTTAGESVVLLNALYATSANAGNPAHRDYMRAWWNGSYRQSLTGISGFIDIAKAVNNAQDFLDGSYAQADTVHLNPSGYSVIGTKIASGVDD